MNNTKKKTGRPAAGAVDGAGFQKRREISVDDYTAEIISRYGAGNLSAGVRRAASLIDMIETAAALRQVKPWGKTMKLMSADIDFARRAIASGKATDEEIAFLDTLVSLSAACEDIPMADYQRLQRLTGGSLSTSTPIFDR